MTSISTPVQPTPPAYDHITLQQRATERLHLFEALVEQADAGMLLTDLHGRITYANRAMADSCGYGAATVGMKLLELIAPDTQADITLDLAGLTTVERTAHELLLVCRDGTRRPVMLATRLIQDASGAAIALAVTIRDLSEERAREQQLRMFETLVENMPDAVSVTGFDGQLLYTNPSFRQLIGAVDQHVPTMVENVLDAAELERLNSEVLPLLLAQGSWRGRTRHRRLDGSFFPSENLGFVIRDGQGKLQGIAAVMRDVTEQVHNEQELRMAKFTLDRSPDNIHWIDPTSAILYANDGACAMLGYTREELQGMTIADFDPVFPMDKWESVWSQLKQQGMMLFETTHRRKDGSTFPVEIVSSFLTFEGQEYGCVFARDISERKRQEAELQRSQALLEQFLNNMPAACYIVDDQGRYLMINDMTARAMSVSREHIAGARMVDVLSPEMARAWQDHARQVLELGEAVAREQVVPLSDGEHAFLSTVFPIRDADNRIPILGGISFDITDRKRNEQELRVFQTLVETAPYGIVVANLEGIITYANPAFQAMSTYGEALIGKEFLQLYAEGQQAEVAEMARRVLEHNSAQSSFSLRGTNKQLIPVRVASYLICDAAGQPLGMTGLFRDLTEQQRAEAERMELQEQIIAVQQAALRELSTPLIPIADGVVVMPLIGALDSKRAQQVLETLLSGVADHQAQTAILDITGVAVVDTQVANALLRAAQAVRLLGANVVLTGIKPEVAQTLVNLGADLSGIVTQSSLQRGIAHALRQAPSRPF